MRGIPCVLGQTGGFLGGQVTAKVDIFSFGWVLWEICTGEHPTFPAKRPIDDAVVVAPPEVAALITQCLQKDWRLRPSAYEVLQVLNNAQPA